MPGFSPNNSLKLVYEIPKHLFLTEGLAVLPDNKAYAGAGKG